MFGSAKRCSLIGESSDNDKKVLWHWSLVVVTAVLKVGLLEKSIGSGVKVIKLFLYANDNDVVVE